MSATNRGAERVIHDAYETPAWPVERLLERLNLPGGCWLEPCAGHGNIIKTVNQLYESVDEPLPNWTAVEIREECQQSLYPLTKNLFIGDFFFFFRSKDTKWDVFITNPPYSLAMEFLLRGFELANHVVLLLRTNFLESEERNEFLQKFPPDVYVLPNRPSFKGGGKTDATSYAWMHWQSGARRAFGKITVLNHTDKKIRGGR